MGERRPPGQPLDLVADFAAFLADHHSRCPICLAADHVRPAQCPAIPDALRRKVGVIALDAAYAAAADKMESHRRATRRRHPDPATPAVRAG